MSGFLTKARAIDNLCFCPPEKFLPFCSTSSYIPLLLEDTTLVACANSKASFISSSLASFFPKQIFSLIVPLNKEAF